MYLRELPLEADPRDERRTRVLVASFLRGASRALDALAHKLALVDEPDPVEPMLEYHGDAAAPEGALYVNGVLVGRLLGVNRL
jgi:hypothetical protein